MKTDVRFWILFIGMLALGGLVDASEPFNEVPVSYQGRFRPNDAAARLWLQSIYHRDSIKQEHREPFAIPSGKASDLLWQLDLRGHTLWDDAPLFWIKSAALKNALSLDLDRSYFSYSELTIAIKKSPQQTDDLLALQQSLLEFSRLQGNILTQEKALESSWKKLQEKHASPKETALSLDMQHPLQQRLSAAGSLLKVLPGRYHPGEWFSLHALRVQVYDSRKGHLVPVDNFTLYPDDVFAAIRSSYAAWTEEPSPKRLDALAETLNHAYGTIAGTPYLEAKGKHLLYPTITQLKIEAAYYHYPWITVVIALYSLACLGLILSRWGSALMAAAFLLHTCVLAMRCYILQRPPVSNMFETVVYVPWIAVLISFFFSNRIIKAAASAAAIVLLVILQLADLNNSLDNVQAVLDSQFWLIIHVLMVVGSYGVFLLSAVLGHIYLGMYLYERKETLPMQAISKMILQTMYLGVALLIPGTILGGVWAAESWGRFWDWDPKESWAFISSCVYVACIHAYRFHHIRSFGLAVGAVMGFLAISFTWYGVNYILGTGLHSYGFGSGGEIYYYLYLVAEILFVSIVANGKLKVPS